MAKGYQRRSRGGSFKIQDFGDLGLRSFKDQQEIIIEALKTQRARTAEYGKDYTRSLSNVAASEEENRKILQNLEDKAYQTRRNAITVRAAREVEALRAKADEYADQSKFWEDFSTTYSKEWGKIATGISDYADHRHAMDVIDDEDRKAAIQAFTTKGTIGGKEVGFEQLVDKASQNISTAADKEPDSPYRVPSGMGVPFLKPLLDTFAGFLGVAPEEVNWDRANNERRAILSNERDRLFKDAKEQWYLLSKSPATRGLLKFPMPQDLVDQITQNRNEVNPELMN